MDNELNTNYELMITMTKLLYDIDKVEYIKNSRSIVNSDILNIYKLMMCALSYFRIVTPEIKYLEFITTDVDTTDWGNVFSNVREHYYNLQKENIEEEIEMMINSL